jgi:hypothetical protein
VASCANAAHACDAVAAALGGLTSATNCSTVNGNGGAWGGATTPIAADEAVARIRLMTKSALADGQ